MIRKRLAVVREILEFDNDVTEVAIEVEHELQKAINYNSITGQINVGDKVLINTNAVYLNLGTGGYNFIIHNYSNTECDFPSELGHIIKLRYTPMQLKCLAVEEPQSLYHETIKDRDHVEGLKVLIGPLHSMLLPAIQILKYYHKQLKISYIMTDSACLPIHYSKTVKWLKTQRLLDYTITCGQAFGGDFETVNVYTALITSKYICKSDIAIITPGPGVVGTDSILGFSSIEGGHLIDAVNTLKGVPIIIPRISFADNRERHQGLSHHTLTILSKIAYSSAFIGLPVLEEEKNNFILDQIKRYNIDQKHRVHYIAEQTFKILNKGNLFMKTMGRGIEQDPDFFRAIGASTLLTLKI
ncbi:MAG: hypothetical protein PWP27_425 [Clostridiales bacterium]|nr:hypothetical protein [Clostridiales bacterium]MDK2932615.1 hypothetical protein [Clostridiales bacterium]